MAPGAEGIGAQHTRSILCDQERLDPRGDNDRLRLVIRNFEVTSAKANRSYSTGAAVLPGEDIYLGRGVAVAVTLSASAGCEHILVESQRYSG